MTAPLLQVSKVSKRFGGLRALQDINVEQRPGELLGMIGPNGSGKSTFVNVVSGTIRCDGGEIRLNGARLDGRAQYEIARAGIARTFQSVRILDQLSVMQNVLAGLLCYRLSRREMDARAREALAKVDLKAEYDTPAHALGLFDRRRLEFATRIVARPKLLMLDEPVAGLNPSEIRSMIDLIQILRNDVGIFIIEHTMKVIINLADRVVVLANGQQLIEDVPSVVLRDARVIDVYLGRDDA